MKFFEFETPVGKASILVDKIIAVTETGSDEGAKCLIWFGSGDEDYFNSFTPYCEVMASIS